MCKSCGPVRFNDRRHLGRPVLIDVLDPHASTINAANQRDQESGAPSNALTDETGDYSASEARQLHLGCFGRGAGPSVHIPCCLVAYACCATPTLCEVEVAQLRCMSLSFS